VLNLLRPDHRAVQAQTGVTHGKRDRPMGRGPVYAQRAHGTARSARGMLRVRAMARLPAAPKWSQVQGVDGPRRGPHDAQCAVTTHSMKQAEAASDETASGKVITRRFQGPRRIHLAWSKAPAHSE
jgi:hypothetical protein